MLQKPTTAEPWLRATQADAGGNQQSHVWHASMYHTNIAIMYPHRVYQPTQAALVTRYERAN